tara:strand:+ start:216 stop:983 length:768 start_codon:yes stop_codon:yes gene_type:complete
MKVVILAGGYGTRLSEYTDVIPKPMVDIGGKPILEHIMNIYSSSGHHDFYLALGYKSHVIKDYFYKYNILNSDFQIDISSGSIKSYQNNSQSWKISLIHTGVDSMTGGRLLRLKDHLIENTFLVTYGDAVADLDINKVIQFHKSHGKLVTVTAVRPPARFGEINIDKENRVVSFLEKPQITQGWINGGFFVMEPRFFDYLEDDKTVLEKSPLENAAKDNQLMAYQHNGFWQCMDTKRDKDNLECMIKDQKANWLK